MHLQPTSAGEVDYNTLDLQERMAITGLKPKWKLSTIMMDPPPPSVKTPGPPSPPHTLTKTPYAIFCTKVLHTHLPRHLIPLYYSAQRHFTHTYQDTLYHILHKGTSPRHLMPYSAQRYFTHTYQDTLYHNIILHKGTLTKTPYTIFCTKALHTS
jgi:hypothetical protein